MNIFKARENDNLPGTLVFKKALDFYINSSLHVALAVVAFSMITYLNFQIPLDFHLLLFIFFGTVTGYNFIKYAEIANFRHYSLSKTLKGIQILSFLAFIGLLITLFFQNRYVILTSAILGLITLLYAFPLPTSYKNLRGIPGLKIYIIAFVVAGVTVVLPLLGAHDFPALNHIIDFIQRAIIALVLVLPFEIRDMKNDMVQLRTIPQTVGISNTKLLGYILTGVFFLMEFLKSEIQLAYTISLMFLGIMTIVFLKNSCEEQGEYYASFWVEAAPWFWLGILYILQIFI